jgi:hypothetical protein
MEEQGDRLRALLEGANKRMKLKRLRRIHLYHDEVGYRLSRETRSRSTSVIGLVLCGWDDANANPDRFIIRPVMDLSSRSIPYISPRPNLVYRA